VRFRPKVAKSLSLLHTLKKDPRGLTIDAQAFHTVFQTRRQSQKTPEFLKIYHQHPGMEATLSQGTRRTCLRRSRYIGLAKTHLQS
jgi:transposase